MRRIMTSTPTRVGVTLFTMRWLLALPLLIALFLVSFVLAFNAGLFQERLVSTIQSSVGGSPQLGPIRLAWTWPLRVTVGPSQWENQNVGLSFKGATLDVLKISQPYHLRLFLDSPEIQVKELAAKGSSTGSGASLEGSSAAKAKAPPLRLELLVKNGVVRSSAVTVKGLELKFEQKLLLASPARVEALGFITTTYVPGEFPFSVASEALTLSAEAVKATELKATLAGLQASVQGASLLKESRHRWSLSIQIPDLSRLPQPPTMIPAKNWRGSVQVKAELVKASAMQAWEADGHFIAQGLSADLNLVGPTYAVKGPLTAELESQFQYHQSRLQSLTLNGDVDASAAQLVLQNKLNKASQVPFKVHFVGTGGDDKLNLSALDIRLAQWRGSVAGVVAIQSPWSAEVSLQVPATSLAGIENLILPLQKSPVAGELAMSLKYTGPLVDPWSSRILIEQLHLKSFSALADYDGAQLKVRGPIQASVEITGEVDKGDPKRIVARGDADFKAAALVVGPLRKEEGRDFSARFKAQNAGESLSLDNLELTSFFGKIQVSGQVRSLAKRDVDLRVTARPLNLSELRIAMPQFHELIPKGELTGSLRGNGQLQIEKPWAEWPLQVSGELAAQLPEYKMMTPSSAQDKGVEERKASASGVAPPSPLLTKGALTQRLNVKAKVVIGAFQKDQLVAKNLVSQGQIANGRYTGSLTVGDIFGGRVDVSGLEVPLFETRPVIQGAAKWQRLTIENVLEFSKPEYKTFATGKSNGQLDFATLLPADEQFLARLKVSGESTLEPVTFNTLKVGDMVNETIQKLPVKIPPAKVEPLQGRVKAQFELSAQTLNISALEGQDLDGSEIRLKGKVTVPDLQGDLVGSFAWSQAPLKGCILEGNSDDQGRLLIPLSIQGNLMKPSVSLLRDVAGKLAAKALACERDKLVDKIKEDGGKSVEKEAKKLLQGIFGK